MIFEQSEYYMYFHAIFLESLKSQTECHRALVITRTPLGCHAHTILGITFSWWLKIAMNAKLVHPCTGLSAAQTFSPFCNSKQKQKTAALLQRWLQVSSFRQLQKCKMIWVQLPSVNILGSVMPRIKTACLQ